MKNNLFIKVVVLIIIINIIGIDNEYMVYAREQKNFKNISIEDGLPQGTIQALYQDKKGYIWIGTNDGLCKYNGYRFYIYGTKENELASSYIMDISEDNEGNIWVATVDGLSKIQVDDNTITNYSITHGGLSNTDINNILIRDNGEMLVATSDGLNIYNSNNDSFIRIFEGDKLVSQYIYSLAEDGNGNIWVATDKGINKINLSTGESEDFSNDDSLKILKDKYIYKVYYDDGYIWVGTHSSGMYRIDLENNNIKNYNTKDNDLGGNTIRDFLKDRNGTMWIATNGGISKFKDDICTTEKNKIYDKNSLIDNNIFTIMQDSTGLIWIGTYSGISIFNPDINIHHYKNDPFDNTTISDNMISAVYEDNDGLLWIGNRNKGIDILNSNGDKIKNITTEEYPNVISSNLILDIEGNEQFVFISTNVGITVIDKYTKTVKTFNEDNGLPGKIVRCIYYDDLGYLWIGTGSGLAVLNLKTDEITDLTDIIEKYSPNDLYIGDIIKDSDGEYWIGTFVSGGLIRINTKKNNVIVYKNDKNNIQSLSNNSVRTLSEGFNGDIWIGTSNGLNRFNKNSEKFDRYTTKEGMSNDTIYGILIDDNENIWCSTNNGISYINSKNNVITNLGVIDGLQSNEFNGNAYYKRKNGELIFGGINGFNVISPNDIEENKNISNVIFDKFEVNGLFVNNIESSRMRYDENNIYIEVFLPNYKNIKGIQYYYMLEGGSSEWIDMNTNSVTLSNLSPGKYTFYVKARDTSGNFSEISKVSFTIKPPFYRNIYALIIYIFIIIFLIYNTKNKFKKLDRMVALKTKELKDEMERNNNLFEKLISMEKNKNNYLINMSHELRTPLNVLYSTEQLISELNKKDNGIDKENLNKYMSIMINNSKRLLKIINDLIDSSKIEYGSYRIDIKEIDIIYLVEEAALSLKDYIEERGITLTVDPEIEEKIVEADPVEIERCIINIVSNAAKFTKPGGNIDVVIKDLENFVQIEIIDNGIGIDKEHQEIIFNRFSQVVDKESEVKGGSGLGLTITKKIIDMHNGKIYVESEVGKGSNFIILLPVKHNK